MVAEELTDEFHIGSLAAAGASAGEFEQRGCGTGCSSRWRRCRPDPASRPHPSRSNPIPSARRAGFREASLQEPSRPSCRDIRQHSCRSRGSRARRQPG